ncbi:hypothetical protein [Mycobacterium sp. IDR2000157661]|uniref:hypothetical protein n=1 Tax=Mycobacterium sp. IDR2000157661 TaxID=2867005 RepID=UPI001EE9B0AF|nr:hypothetical protein [Mycobacterium sp. IDR2000157661]
MASGIGSSDCERIVDAALAQPVLALTSVAYVAAGLIAVIWAARLRAPLSLAAGVALVAVGAGSIVYHGPQPSWAGPVHDWPIVLLGLLCVLGVVRSGMRRDWSGWLMPATIFGVGLVAYVAGRSGSPLCRPDSLWQFHGAWHVLSAVAALAAAVVMARGDDGPGRDET